MCSSLSYSISPSYFCFPPMLSFMFSFIISIICFSVYGHIFPDILYLISSLSSRIFLTMFASSIRRFDFVLLTTSHYLQTFFHVSHSIIVIPYPHLQHLPTWLPPAKSFSVWSLFMLFNHHFFSGHITSLLAKCVWCHAFLFLLK